MGSTPPAPPNPNPNPSPDPSSPTPTTPPPPDASVSPPPSLDTANPSSLSPPGITTGALSPRNLSIKPLDLQPRRRRRSKKIREKKKKKNGVALISSAIGEGRLSSNFRVGDVGLFPSEEISVDLLCLEEIRCRGDGSLPIGGEQHRSPPIRRDLAPPHRISSKQRRSTLISSNCMRPTSPT
ncbi:hypothetical protein LWI29_017340 [Acer saccharum]|uniref:Uncharacterized protein n=1 Tax=Acer saccharum TaxID=4024 RepID=A0AA39TTR3_ACESA|nr:hypothetical protein LWI29_017340 [Acer saccharum]